MKALEAQEACGAVVVVVVVVARVFRYSDGEFAYLAHS